MEEKFLDSNINEDIYDTEVIIGSTPGGCILYLTCVPNFH